MSVLISLITFTLLPSVFAGIVQWEDCGSTLNITELRITDCSGPNHLHSPCIFIKGQKYDIEFDASSNEATEHLPYTVQAKFLWTALTLFEGDACEELSKGSCPIKDGGLPFTFLKSFDMELPFPTYSPVSTMITARMASDAGDTLICARLFVQIRSAATKSSIPLISFFGSYFRSAPFDDLAPETFFSQARTLYI